MLSIVIVNWNTCEHLRRCLTSIFTFGLPAMETIVIDNASNDGSAEMVRADFPQVKLIANTCNAGYAAANNVGIAHSAREYVLLLNPDTEFFDNSLEIGARIMELRADVGVLAAKLVDATTGTTQRSVRAFPRPIAVLADIFRVSFLMPARTEYRQRSFDYEKESEIEQPMGTFLLFRRAALGNSPYFDEAFPIFFNDVDLLWRVKKTGWKILYSPEVCVRHYGGASTKQVRKAMIWESHRSLIRYMRKWHTPWWSTPLSWPLFGLIWVGALIRARGWNAGFRP